MLAPNNPAPAPLPGQAPIGVQPPANAPQAGGFPGVPPPWQKNVALPFGQEEKPAPEDLEDVTEVVDLNVDTLVGMVNKEFSDYRQARMPQELGIWIKAFLNNKGVYAGDTELNGGTSAAFVQATGPKVRTALAMMMQIILPPGDKAWTVEPPTEPVMIDEAFDLMAQGMDPAQLKATLRGMASKACEALELKMEGGLEEAANQSKLLRLAFDTILFGTGFAEGPLAVDNYPELGDEEEDESFIRRLINRVKEAVGLPASKKEKLKALIKAGAVDRYRFDFHVHSPFEVYVDPGARALEDSRSVIIRMVVSRQQLREFRNKPGFDKDALNAVLNDNTDGNWKCESWESIIATGNANFQQNVPNGRFVILKRWGMVSGQDLRDSGVDVPDDQLEDQVMAQVWVCGDKIIRLSISDELHKDRIPMYMPRYAVSPHSPYGIGLPEMMFDSQDSINACERAKNDNMAFICRPQVIIRTARLDLGDTTEALEFVPGKIWKIRESQLPENGMKPVDFWVPANALKEVSAVQQESMALSDEQTGQPRFLMGQNSEGTHNRTFGGATLQFDRSVTPFKTVIFNFENDFTVPFTKKVGEFYQLFSNDPAIKGDFRIVAQGVQGLMARELLAGRIGDALSALGNNPQLSQEATSSLSPAKLFDKFLMGTGLASQDIFYTPAEKAQREQQQAQQDAQQQQNALETAMAPKLRAETPPKDALLEALKEAPDGSQSKLVLLGLVTKAFNFNDPSVETAIQHDMAREGFNAMAEVHQHGVDMANREMEPPPPPPAGPTGPVQ